MLGLLNTEHICLCNFTIWFGDLGVDSWGRGGGGETRKFKRAKKKNSEKVLSEDTVGNEISVR